MIIDNKLIEIITEQARENPRLRMNYNLHESLDSKAQRLINVLLPGTALPIHRHQHTSETYIILKGKMYVVFYNEVGAQTQRFLLNPDAGNYGVQIPKGQFHGIEVIEPTAIIEIKEGPYTPLQPEDTLD